MQVRSPGTGVGSRNPTRRMVCARLRAYVRSQRMLESARGRRSTRRRRSMDPALGGGRLSFGQKLARLGQRMHDPEWRRYARLVFAGKILGFGALIAVIL